jgi:hypothetical protein
MYSDDLAENVLEPQTRDAGIEQSEWFSISDNEGAYHY